MTGAFGADADNQARVRLVLVFVLSAFAFGVSCFRFAYHSTYTKKVNPLEKDLTFELYSRPY